MKEGQLKKHGVLLKVAYEGTDYSGWQIQPKQNTIQGMLKKAIELADPTSPKDVQVFGASRTDAGVHAMGQMASFSTQKNMPPEAWRHAIGKHLPPSISIVDAKACDPDYNPRFDSIDKKYRYLIHVGRSHNPLTRNQAWHIGPQLARIDISPHDRNDKVDDWFDIQIMREAASQFIGTFDYKAFQSANDERTQTVRTIFETKIIPHWQQNPQMLAIEIIGNAFLKNMVRIMVGTLIEIGRKHLEENKIEKLLTPHATRTMAGPTAPPQGLYLVNINLKTMADNDSLQP